MVAELHTKTEWGDQVDNKNSVLFNWVATNDNVEKPHESHKFKENQENTESDENGNLNSAQNLNRKENGYQSKLNILSKDTCDVCILIIINIEQTVAENGWDVTWFCVVDFGITETDVGLCFL